MAYALAQMFAQRILRHVTRGAVQRARYPFLTKRVEFGGYSNRSISGISQNIDFVLFLIAMIIQDGQRPQLRILSPQILQKQRH